MSMVGGVRSGDGDYYVKGNGIRNPGSYQGSDSRIPSYATRGHSSLTGNGDGDCRNLTLGYASDKESVLSRRGTSLTTANQESWTGNGDQYNGGVQSKRNGTSVSLRESPQLNLWPGNGFNSSQGGHHHRPNASKALPRNYVIDSSYAIPTTNSRLGQRYGKDRERMKDELADSNSMARTGSGILPGGILPDRSRGLSHLLWRGTRSDTNSSIRKPEMYSSSIVPGTTSTPSLNTNSTGGRNSGINEQSENTRVSSLIAEAQKAKDTLRSNISETNNQFQDRITSYTRPTATWNTVGNSGGGGMTMADLEKERYAGHGTKKLQQDAYRKTLERQVEQKSRRMAEEERKLNTHPFGPNYEQPKPSFWQSSQRSNRPEDIAIQKRVLAQNSSTRISQYDIPCNRVTQARTNLQNSRISPDAYRHPSKNAGNHYTNTTNKSQHYASNSSDANNFRAHSSPSTGNNVFFEGGRLPHHLPQAMHPEQRYSSHPQRPQQPPPFYPSQRQQMIPPQPQFIPPAGYQYPTYPGAYSYPPQPPLGYYPYHPVPGGYQQQCQPGLNQSGQYNHQFPASSRHLSENNRPEYPESNRRSYLDDDDDVIEQKVFELQRQMRIEEENNSNNTNSSWNEDGNGKSSPLKPSKSMHSDIEKLRNFVEEKLSEKNVDFDQLREIVVGRPNNWKTSNTALDLKPIKDMINRAELAEQIKINQRKKALKAAQEKEEEEKLERKIQEYYDIQKTREQNAETQKEQWTRMHNLNKKAVSQHFLTEAANFQHKPEKSKSKQTSRVLDEPFRKSTPLEDPEESLARKIRSRGENRSQSRDNVGAGDRVPNFYNNEEPKSSEYSYAKYMEQFRRPPSPPVPALLAPKTNEDTLRGKLSNKTFSRPRLSPSILHANASDLRSRIAVEHGLKNKFSNPSF